MAAGYDGRIKIDSRIDGKGFDSGIASMMGKLKGLAVAIGIAFGVGAIINFGKTAVSAASDLASSMIGLQSVVEGTGNSFSAAKGFINDYIKDGLVPITNATTAYKNLLMRGYDISQIEATLTALKDSASFGRQASLTLGNAVQSATEGLKNENSILVDNAGVTKNVLMMWKDYAASIGTTVGALTKQQKIQAEVAGILEESRFQVGDAAKLAGTYAGQVSALGVSFYNLKTAIGNSIIPIISKVMPYIKIAVDWLVVFFNKVAQFMSALFGVQISGAADSVSALADSTNEAAGAQDKLADSTAKAGKAAKGALAPFDELNVLQMDEGDGGAAGGSATGPTTGGGGIAGIGMPEEIDAGLEDIKAKVAAFKESLLTFIAPVIEAFGRLKDALIPLGETIWEGLKWAWDNILVPLGSWVITDVLPVFLDLVGAAATVLNSALVALQPLGIWLWENFLQPLAAWTGQAIIDALKWLVARLNDISTWINTHQDAFQTIATIIGIFAASWIAVNAAITIWNVVGAIATGVTTAFAAAMAFLTSPITLVVAAIAAVVAIVYVLIKYWPEISAWAIKAWENIKKAWNEAGQWFKGKVIDPIVNWFDQAWKNIKNFVSDTWQGIKNILSSVGSWIREKVTDPIKNAFQTALDWVKNKWDTIFDGLKNIAKSVINAIIDSINAFLRFTVAPINVLIKGVNVVARMVGFSSIPEISAPQIPRLATGAVIPANAPFAAILGDQKSGTNIEAPESLLRSLIREELGNQNGQKITIDFGNSTLGALIRTLNPVIKQENERMGSSLLSGASS